MQYRIRPTDDSVWSHSSTSHLADLCRTMRVFPLVNCKVTVTTSSDESFGEPQQTRTCFPFITVFRTYEGTRKVPSEEEGTYISALLPSSVRTTSSSCGVATWWQSQMDSKQQQWRLFSRKAITAPCSGWTLLPR